MFATPKQAGGNTRKLSAQRWRHNNISTKAGHGSEPAHLVVCEGVAFALRELAEALSDVLSTLVQEGDRELVPPDIHLHTIASRSRHELVA